MKHKTMILSAMLGLIVAAPPSGHADEETRPMSDVQHKKQHMGGLHHPKDGKESKHDDHRPMSDIQHKKQHMGGMHHPEDGKESKHDDHRPMSDIQHKKQHMGGMHHPEDGEKSTADDMKHMKMKGAFMREKDIDGYHVTFHIMKAPAGNTAGGSHHLMLKVTRDGAISTDLVVNSKVVHPGGQSESKMMMRMGDWYMTAYDLGHAGRHQVMVLFKTPDGKKHFGGIFYPAGGNK